MNDQLLQKSAEFLLLGSFGVALILSIRRGESLALPFERLILGYFAILFCKELFSYLKTLGQELDLFCGKLGSQEEIKDFIVRSMFAAASKYDAGTGQGMAGNLANYLGQIFRTGVWGIISSLVELIFVLARFLLEIGRDALWEIVLIFFPLAAGVFPISPKVPAGLLLLALELCLWMPILTIINVTTSKIARDYSQISDSVGFYVLALEIISICLTFCIPMIAHQLISGSMSGNIAGSWQSTLQIMQKLLSVPNPPTSLKSATKFFKGKSNAILLFIISSMFFSFEVHAAEAIQLRLGFVKKIPCSGTLFISAIGNENLAQLEALPKSLGCAVILKPLRMGKTNLILETSSGSIERTIYVTGESTIGGKK